MCFTEIFERDRNKDDFRAYEDNNHNFGKNYHEYHNFCDVNDIDDAINLRCNNHRSPHERYDRNNFIDRNNNSERDFFSAPINCLRLPTLCCNRRCSNRCNCNNNNCNNDNNNGNNNGNNNRHDDETLIPYSTNCPVTLTTHPSGVSRLGASLAFPGGKCVEITNGCIAAPNAIPYSFSATHDGIISCIEGSFFSDEPIHLPSHSKTLPYLILAISSKGENLFHVIQNSKAFADAPLIGGTTYQAFLVREIAKHNLNIKVRTGDKIAVIGAIEVLHADTGISLELNFEAGVMIKL